VDVRLNNVSQLSGFAKRDDLEFFAREICRIDYVHVPELAPSAPLLAEYRGGKVAWPDYEKKFLKLMRERKVEDQVPKALLEGGCLLCSEHLPHHCHRRLVAEYLNEKWGGAISVDHLT
jgi:uncharacterized protein (DUF488 family)